MKVRICYLDLRTPGYENWYLAARQAGVEFLRGLPAEIQHDEQGKPVVEVEDMTAQEKRLLRPDLVVLSSGFVPSQDGQRLARTLGVHLDDDGFIDILDRKNRATETSSEGIFVCGSASGPKALVECNTEASAVASEVHNFLASLGRLTARPSEILPDRCVGCGQCQPACPYGAIAPRERPAGAPRPEGLRADAPLSAVDPEACRACGICAAACPELAARHSLSDDAIYGRMRLLMEGVERPVLGFYCKECAGAAISLSGMRHDSYPVDVRLVELPCLGRVSALHILEAARLGAAASSWRDAPRDDASSARATSARPSRRGRRTSSSPAPARRSPSSCGICAPWTATPLPGTSGFCVTRHEVTAMTETISESARRQVLQIAEECRDCYQCAQCTSACPSGWDLDRGPRLVIRLLLSRDTAQILACEDIWRCNDCHACSRACPMEIDIAGILSKLRMLELEQGGQRCPEREAARVAVRRLARQPRVNNIAFGTAMASRGYLPWDIRGAIGAVAHAVVHGRPVAAESRPAETIAQSGHSIFFAGCALRQDAVSYALTQRVARDVGLPLVEADGEACCGHPTRGRQGPALPSSSAALTACPGCESSLRDAGIAVTPLWEALVEEAARRRRRLAAAAPAFVPYVGCMGDRGRRPAGARRRRQASPATKIHQSYASATCRLLRSLGQHVPR